MRICTKNKIFKVVCSQGLAEVKAVDLKRGCRFEYSSNGEKWFKGFLTREMFWIFGDSYIELI
jgi:hypothetical protein